MRTSLFKAVAGSITALVLCAAPETTPAWAFGAHGGPSGGSGGFYQSGGGPSFGGSRSFNAPSFSAPSFSAPSFGGSFPHGNTSPSGTFTPKGNTFSHGNLIPKGSFTPGAKTFPPKGPSWSPGNKHHHRFPHGWRYRHVWGGGVVIEPEYCDDYSCDTGYYYDDSACWVYRRVYDRHGKFVGWRQVYICQDDQ